MLTVAQLVELLKTFPQDLPVAYDLFSEHCVLEPQDTQVMECCIPRPDGWVHRARPDQARIKYLMLPGN